MIAGLPFVSANQDYAENGFIITHTGSPAVLQRLYPVKNNTAIFLVTLADVPISNQDMSGSTTRFMVIYPTS